MEISVESREQAKIIRLAGRLDAVTSPDLEKWAEDMAESPSGGIIMDFSELEYISSAGLRVILNLSRTMKTHTVNFSICNLQAHVREVFEISGFDTIIPIFQTVEECFK